MVARLTPDQKAACSNHVGVSNIFLFLVFSLNTHLLESFSRSVFQYLKLQCAQVYALQFSWNPFLFFSREATISQ